MSQPIGSWPIKKGNTPLPTLVNPDAHHDKEEVSTMAECFVVGGAQRSKEEVSTAVVLSSSTLAEV